MSMFLRRDLVRTFTASHGIACTICTQVVQALLYGYMHGICDALCHLELWGLRLEIHVPSLILFILHGFGCNECTQVVQAFLSGRMRGIGDALYHLELWGLRLDYAQQALDEIDFSVHSLREDLRWVTCNCMVQG